MPPRLTAYFELLTKNPRLPFIMMGGLFLGMVFTLTQVVAVLRLHDPILTNHAPTQTALPNHINIPQLHVFGEYERTLGELPSTSLQLTLQGIAVGLGDSSESRALIAAPHQATNVYKIGDSVPGGAIIREILRDRIILDDKGRYESLTLPVPQMAGTLTGVH